MVESAKQNEKAGRRRGTLGRGLRFQLRLATKASEEMAFEEQPGEVETLRWSLPSLPQPHLPWVVLGSAPIPFVLFFIIYVLALG